jgi:hypothetical protein
MHLDDCLEGDCCEIHAEAYSKSVLPRASIHMFSILSNLLFQIVYQFFK